MDVKCRLTRGLHKRWHSQKKVREMYCKIYLSLCALLILWHPLYRQYRQLFLTAQIDHLKAFLYAVKLKNNKQLTTKASYIFILRKHCGVQCKLLANLRKCKCTCKKVTVKHLQYQRKTMLKKIPNNIHKLGIHIPQSKWLLTHINIIVVSNSHNRENSRPPKAIGGSLNAQIFIMIISLKTKLLQSQQLAILIVRDT